MQQAPNTSRQFGSIVRRAIRNRVPGAQIANLTVKATKFPTGIKGYTATGTATAQGRTAEFRAVSNGSAFRVSFFNEEAA